jgi:signal transduction histidine kinase
LHGFTRRADILLRQLSFSEASQHALLDSFEALAPLPEAEQDVHLRAAAEHLTGLAMGFVDPDQLRLLNSERKRRVDTRAEMAGPDDPIGRRRLFVEQALERAFAMNNRQLYDYLVATLAGGHEIRTTSLPIRDARELLYAAHVLEVGAAGWEGMGLRFEVRETERRTSTEYFAAMDEFTVRLVEEPAHAAR